MYQISVYSTQVDGAATTNVDNTYVRGLAAQLKVSTRRKASHNLNITGIGVDRPIQTYWFEICFYYFSFSLTFYKYYTALFAKSQHYKCAGSQNYARFWGEP